MASHLVDKMAAAHLLEAVRSTVGHLSRARLNASGPESEEGKSLAQLYARTRRLLQFVERAFDTYEDPIPVEIGAGDQNLLASCLLMEFGAAVVKLRRPNGKQSEEGFIRAKLQLLRHWIAAFATRQLGSIPGDPNAAEPEVKAVAHEVMTALGVQREVNMCFGAAPGAWEKDGEHGGGGVRSPVAGAAPPGGQGRGGPRGRPGVPGPGARPPQQYAGGGPGPTAGGGRPGGVGPGAMAPGGRGPHGPQTPHGRGMPRQGGPMPPHVGGGGGPGGGYPQGQPRAPMPGGPPPGGGRPVTHQQPSGRPPQGHGVRPPARPGPAPHHGYQQPPEHYHRPAPQGYAAPPVYDQSHGSQSGGGYGQVADGYGYSQGDQVHDPDGYGYAPDGYGYAPDVHGQPTGWDDQGDYDDPQGYDDPRGYDALSTDDGAIRRYLLDPNRLRDPRLRTLMSLDLEAWARSLDASDLRLAAVHLLSVLEGAVLDHVVPRAARLGLRGGPDTWRLQELLVAILPQVAPADRGRLAMLERCQNLVRPARQLREPMVVTEGILADLAQFVIRVLTELGFRGEDD